MDKPKGFEGNRYDKYLDYIDSDAWTKLRSERLLKDNFRCSICGSPEQLNVHHIFYPAELGKESIDDLITLCQSCHDLVEYIKKEGRTYRHCQKYEFTVKVQVTKRSKEEINDFIRGTLLPDGNLKCYFYAKESSGYFKSIETNLLGIKKVREYFEDDAKIIIGGC